MIYILLPVHNRRKITRRFIDCLNEQKYTNYHLVLIDDGSTDGTAEMVENYVHTLTIIRGKGNWWWAGSLQQGYKWLKLQKLNNDDIVLLINDDTTFKDDFLKIGQTILIQHPHTLLLAHAYSQQDNRLIDAGVHIDWKQLSFKQAKTPEEINCLSTRGLFIKAIDFIKLRGFYPNILSHYFSDYEFTIRAKRKGLKLMTHPSLYLTSIPNLNKNNNLFWLSYFSKRTPNNPIDRTVLVLLACPWKWKFQNILKIWFSPFLTKLYRIINDKIF